MTIEEYFEEWWTPKELPENGFNKTAMLDFAERYHEHKLNETLIKNLTSNDAKPVLPAVFFFGIKVVRYRIVKDDYLGYECQIWRLWFPFWCQMNFCNTHHTLEKAIAYIEKHRKVVLSS